MRRRSHAVLPDEQEAVDSAATSPPADRENSPPSKRTRTRGATTSSPPTPTQAQSITATADSFSSSTAKTLGGPASLSSFDCAPTLSILPDYIHHHHSLVTQHATALSTHLQRNISRTQQLTAALQHALGQLDQQDDTVRRAQQQLRAERRRSERRVKAVTDETDERIRKLIEDKEREVEAATADKSREIEKVRRDLTRERKERREVEESEKVSAEKWVEYEKKQKTLERKLTIAEKKNKKYEEAEERHQSAMQQLQQKLSTLSSSLPSSSSSSSLSSSTASSPSSTSPQEVQSLQRQVESLQVRLSYYESGPASLPTLTSRDLALLSASLQQHLDTVKEEEQARKECKVCMTESASVVFVPCGHMICCVRCADGCTDCPVCRVRIDKRIQTKT